MRWGVLALLLMLLPVMQEPLYAAASEKMSVQEIDQRIEELKEMKRGYEARAIRAEDQAGRLQFEDRFVLETRRYNRIAEENRAKAAKVQEEIDRLEKQKASMQGKWRQ